MIDKLDAIPGFTGRKIIDGLKDAVAGNFAAVTIEGQRWVRDPAPTRPEPTAWLVEQLGGRHITLREEHAAELARMPDSVVTPLGPIVQPPASSAEPVAWQCRNLSGRWITMSEDWNPSENAKGYECRPLGVIVAPPVRSTASSEPVAYRIGHSGGGHHYFDAADARFKDQMQPLYATSTSDVEVTPSSAISGEAVAWEYETEMGDHGWVKVYGPIKPDTRDYRCRNVRAMVYATPSRPDADSQGERIDPDYVLPCDVHLPPATRIRKGCKLSTLVTGIKQRERWSDEGIDFTQPQDGDAERESFLKWAKSQYADIDADNFTLDHLHSAWMASFFATRPSPAPAAVEALRDALKPFAAFADPRNKIPPDTVLTAGSAMAKKQITMADCYAAEKALATLDGKGAAAGDGK